MSESSRAGGRVGGAEEASKQAGMASRATMPMQPVEYSNPPPLLIRADSPLLSRTRMRTHKQV